MPTSLGPAEILVILIVALIVLGPKRLPEAGRQVGKALAEVRRWTTEVKSEIHSVIDIGAPAGSTVVAPTVVSASPTAVDTEAEAEVPVAEVVAPVTVSGTATGVDTQAEVAPAPDAAVAEPVLPAEPVTHVAPPPAETMAVDPTEVTAVEETEVTAETLAVVPADATAVDPTEVTAVVPAEVTAVVPAEPTDIVPVGSPAEPTVELPESPPADPARP